MNYYAGLDVSLKATAICIVDEKRKIVREGKVSSEPDFVEEGDRPWRGWRLQMLAAPADCAGQASAGSLRGISLASFRRFWAVAARRNSSRAPHGPLSRSRSSPRMRLRWAKSISTFLRA
jgi:hypothetical protein